METIDAMWAEIDKTSLTESREESAARIAVLSDAYRDEGQEEFADYLKLMSRWPHTVPISMRPCVKLLEQPVRKLPDDAYPSRGGGPYDRTRVGDYATQSIVTYISVRTAVEDMFAGRKVKDLYFVEGGIQYTRNHWRYLANDLTFHLVTDCNWWSSNHEVCSRTYYADGTIGIGLSGGVRSYGLDKVVQTLGFEHDRPNDLYSICGSEAEVTQKMKWLLIYNRTGVALWLNT